MVTLVIKPISGCYCSSRASVNVSIWNFLSINVKNNKTMCIKQTKQNNKSCCVELGGLFVESFLSLKLRPCQGVQAEVLRGG